VAQRVMEANEITINLKKTECVYIHIHRRDGRPSADGRVSEPWANTICFN